MIEDGGLERLAGKALLDEEFRKRLLSDPEGTAHAEGVTLTEYQMKNLRAVRTSNIEEWLTQLKGTVEVPLNAVGRW
ncbi:MAG: Os1348 family NHLP clan protein [Thermoleophilia bacterium]|jgi:hypothetical protein